METFTRIDVPEYLRRMVASYFFDRVLKYDTESGPEEYRVTRGIPMQHYVRWILETRCQTRQNSWRLQIT